MDEKKTTLGETKRRLLTLLKKGGAATSAELAEALEITEAAVRQHLSDLETARLVEAEPAEPSGRGRPALRWSLTELAADLFPDRHLDLTLGLITATRRALGERGLDRVLAERAEETVKGYRKRVPPASAPLRSRVAALARLRTEEGYMASVERADGGGYLLIEHHCPICDAAKACAGLCRTELEVFRRVLGSRVIVERTGHLLSGDKRCAYHIRAR